MKKFLTVFACFLILTMAGTSFSWEGRMEGMGKPSGLIEDESDFLTHPAKVASSGEGVKYYLDYQFTYTDVMHWKYKLDQIDQLYDNALYPYRFNSSSSDVYNHNSLAGVVFPLVKGRMGVFFSYDKKMGDYDGNGSYVYYDDNDAQVTKRLNYDLDSNLANYALRLMYGLPVKSADIGFELGFAHRSEEEQNETVVVPEQLGFNSKMSKNYIYGWGTPELSLFPFMLPCDSSYWELFGKAGVEKKLDRVDISWSVRGGYILHADSKNRYEYLYQAEDELESEFNQAKMRGDVRGYNIGSDLWIRHRLNECLTLPYLVSVNYTQKRRDGDAMGIGLDDIEENHFYQYNQMTRTFDIKLGGGVEKKVNTCGLIGAGLYYNYLQSHDALSFFVSGAETGTEGLEHLPNDQNEFPLHKEHRLILNLAGEQEVSSGFTIRGGLNFFYGWVIADNYKQKRISADTEDNLFNSYIRKISLDGANWGLEGSLGATKQFSFFTVEPFLKGGYRKVNLSGNGKAPYIIPYEGSTDNYLDSMKKEREEWCLGAGVSLLFGK